MKEIIILLFTDYTLRTVALASVLIGMSAGVLGTFALLRKQSLLGDTISHAALPGVALAFLLTLNKEPLILILGAVLAGWVGTLLIFYIINYTKIKEDAAMGIVLSSFFGFGIALLTYIQKLPTANQAGLNKFLFGNASTLIGRDVVIISIFSIIVLIFVLIFWKEFKILSFDPDFAFSLGFPVKILDILLTTLLVIAITIGLQAVGVVLMSAMIVAPGAAARQWTNKLNMMVLLAAFFGCLAALLGTVSSSLVSKLPTGPAIVVYISIIVFVSLLFASKRGIIWRMLKQRKNQGELMNKKILETLYLFAKGHHDFFHAHSISSIEAVVSVKIKKNLTQLQQKGLLISRDQNYFSLTEKGLAEIKNFIGEKG